MIMYPLVILLLCSFVLLIDGKCGTPCTTLTDCSDKMICNADQRCDDDPSALIYNPPVCSTLNCRNSFVYRGPTIDQDHCFTNQTYLTYSCSPPLNANRNFGILYYFDLVNEGVAKCDKKHYPGTELVVAISTGWYSNGGRCFENVTITALNGRSVVARIVDECISTSGCTEELFNYGPCSPKALSGTQGVWDALGMNISEGIIQITWNFTDPSLLDSSGKSSGYTRIIVVSSVAAGVGACVIIILTATWLLLRRRVQKEHLTVEEGLFKPLQFKFSTLNAATGGFVQESKVGEGGYGPVYKGQLTDGRWIAVKRVGRYSRQGLKQFKAEVTSIGKIHHVNLVKLLGFSIQSPDHTLLLVYEYVTNGSLDRWIFDKSRTLSWRTRVRIALDVAVGLDYLHTGCREKILHLDIKPQNILLDENMTAKISDFGCSKLVQKDKSHTKTAMRGTKGYMAPEWLCSRVTEKTDVYSYGVLLLELIHCEKQDVVRDKLESESLEDVKPEEAKSELDMEWRKMVKIALLCIKQDPVARPSMRSIVKWLEDIQSADFSLSLGPGNLEQTLSDQSSNVIISMSDLHSR